MKKTVDAPKPNAKETSITLSKSLQEGKHVNEVEKEDENQAKQKALNGVHGVNLNESDSNESGAASNRNYDSHRGLVERDFYQNY